MLSKNEILQERYRIIQQLGHGGMGAVYEAQDERLGSAVALKEITIDLDKIPTEKQRELLRRAFEREAKLLANLHHEVFPRVMDYFSEQNRQFLIMELVQGDDLSELLLQNKKPFTLNEVTRWLEDLLDALDYLHTQTLPIFHRDIKPQNLKLTSRGKIKLLDFGIAKSVDKSGSTITNQTFVGATLDYAPIEQVLPAVPIAFRQLFILKHKIKTTAILEQSTDARCDIYAVGATFYHLLTNHVPIDSPQRSLQIWEGGNDPLPNPSEFNPDIPQTVSVWLLKALEIDRENRFSSAIEMQKDLQMSINKAKSEILNRTFVLPNPKLSKEQRRKEAETENLVENVKPPAEITPKTISVTQPFLKESITESFPLSEISSPRSNSQTGVTETPYFDVKILEEKRTSPEIKPVASQSVKQSNKKKPLLWFLPVVVIGVLAVAGVGGLAWFVMSSNNLSANNISVSNEIVTTPTGTVTPVAPDTSALKVTPTILPNITPSSSRSVSPIPKETLTPSPTSIKTPTETPKPTATPTPKPPKSSLDLGGIDRMFIELNNDPTATGYIVNYGSASEVAERRKLIINRLKSRGVSLSRVTIVNGGIRSNATTQFWIVPQGAAPPTP